MGTNHMPDTSIQRAPSLAGCGPLERVVRLDSIVGFSNWKIRNRCRKQRRLILVTTKVLTTPQDGEKENTTWNTR